jgi:hypothetical protein
MVLAGHPDQVVLARLSSWDLEDVAALESGIVPVRFSSKSGVISSCHVRDCLVESPDLSGVRMGSVRRAKSCKLVKIRKGRESGVEHNMF